MLTLFVPPNHTKPVQNPCGTIKSKMYLPLMKYFHLFLSIFNNKLLFRRCGSVRLPLTMLASVLLAACASPITTKVTSFNQWPLDVTGATFSYTRPADKLNDLEQQTYESYVQLELEKLGLKPATAGQSGRIQVDLSTASNVRNQQVREPIYQDNYVFISPYRNAAGNVFPGSWIRDPFGPRYVGDREFTRVLQSSSLRLRLLDTQGTTPGKPHAVFESTAIHEGTNENLVNLVPYLVRAVFDGFPGQNGQVRLVKFDRKTGAMLKN